MGEDRFGGPEEERFRRRVDFLASRADAHIGTETASAQAIAATLLRDAACVALLLDESEKAAGFFARAGRLLIGLGLPAGFLLLALGDRSWAQAEFAAYPDIVHALAALEKEAEAPKAGAWPPMLQASLSAPRQLLSFVQACWLASDVEAIAEQAYGPVRDALERHRGRPLDGAGISTGAYLEVVDWFRSVAMTSQGKERPPPAIQLDIEALVAARREQIRAAMADGFHWRLMPKPAALLNLDVMTLCMVADRQGVQLDAMFAAAAETPFVDAPLRAARALSGRDRPQPLLA